MIPHARLAGLIAAAAALTVQASPQVPLRVMVSIPPQIEIVERVGGDDVTVEALIPPGRSPATYDPSPRQLAALARADMLIPIGVPFERQVIGRMSTVAPDVSVCAGPTDNESPETGSPSPEVPRDTTTHSHGSQSDPHFWLDPILAIEHAETICECLCTIAPGRCRSFQDRVLAYRRELESIDREIAQQLKPLAGKTMLVFHPAFGFFAQRYGLHQLAIERDGKEPSARHLTEIINQAQALEVGVIFVQPQFKGSSVRAVADATGAVIVELDPLAADLAANLKRIADTVALGLGGGAIRTGP